MIFNCNSSGIFHKFTKDVDPEWKYVEKLRGGIQWYMMETSAFISNISFKLKHENGKLVSFSGQGSIASPLSNNEDSVVFPSKEMPKTLMKSRIRFLELKPEPNQNLPSSPLPSMLQTFKQRLLSGNGFVVYDGSL